MPDGHPAPPQQTRLRFDSDPFAIREALARIMAELAPLALDEDARMTVEIVLAEVLNNVAEHAYRCQPGGVELSMRRSRGRLVFTVRDGGLPMPGGKIPPGLLPQGNPDDLDDLPEGGFGWFLIRSQAESLSYRREGRLNRLSFALRVPQKAKCRGHPPASG